MSIALSNSSKLVRFFGSDENCIAEEKMEMTHVENFLCYYMHLIPFVGIYICIANS